MTQCSTYSIKVTLKHLTRGVFLEIMEVQTLWLTVGTTVNQKE